MSRPEVVVVDYGMGNLHSVRRALEHCGGQVSISADPASIVSASRLVIPGVGAFAHGMAELRRLGLDGAIREAVAGGTETLGICLGMQMLLDESEEFGRTTGLGLIRGKVVAIPRTGVDGQSVKIPHVGWNELEPAGAGVDWGQTVLSGIRSGRSVYFVHSFMAMVDRPGDCIALTRYGGLPIAAVIKDANVTGCQFHPEKSGEAGLEILRGFLEG